MSRSGVYIFNICLEFKQKVQERSRNFKKVRLLSQRLIWPSWAQTLLKSQNSHPTWVKLIWWLMLRISWAKLTRSVNHPHRCWIRQNRLPHRLPLHGMIRSISILLIVPWWFERKACRSKGRWLGWLVFRGIKWANSLRSCNKRRIVK